VRAVRPGARGGTARIVKCPRCGREPDPVTGECPGEYIADGKHAAVQPEAPTTEAGRALYALLHNDERWIIDTPEPILAIEAEARAASQERPPLTTEERAAALGARLQADHHDEHHQHHRHGDCPRCFEDASQERPQPDATIALGRLLGRVQQMYEDWPTLDMEIEADIAQAKAAIESRGVAQERPQPPLHGHQYGGDWVECTDEHPGVAQERPQHHDLPGHKAHECRICGEWTERC
jgi:hypothetical protein